MLEILSRYKKSVIGSIVTFMVALSMLGFGVNMGGSNHSDIHAIKIDDAEISPEEFYQERRGIEERYRSVFGKNYEELMKSASININQITTDNIISRELFLKEAKALGLTAGQKQISELIKKEFFPKGFSKDLYSRILSNYGVTATKFEDNIRKDLVFKQLSGIVEDVSIPSKKEIEDLIKKEYTKYDLKYIQIDPSSFKDEASKVNQDVLQKFYDTHSTEFEEPSKISYNYSVLNVDTFPNLVDIKDEDLELYYTEHIREFNSFDEIKAKHIQLTYPQNADEKQKDELNKKAEAILQKLIETNDFDKYADYYSDDFATKNIGGELGWIQIGKFKPEFEKPLFKLKDSRIPTIVKLPYGISIVKVEDFKKGEPKPFNEVKDIIKKTITQTDGPSFLFAKANELFDKWDKSNKTLPDFTLENNLITKTSSGLKNAYEDPETSLTGLTLKIISSPDKKKQIIELKDQYIIVEINDFKESYLPSLSEIRTKVVDKYAESEMLNIAKSKALSYISDLKANKNDFQVLKDKYLFEIKEIKSLQKALSNSQEDEDKLKPFNSPTLRDKITEITKLDYVQEDPLVFDGKVYLFKVSGITPPDAIEIGKHITEYTSLAKNNLVTKFMSSLSNSFKAKSNIDVDPRFTSGVGE